MFISKRAFNLTNTIQYKSNRWHYESLFGSKYSSIPIRFKGILNDKATPGEAVFDSIRFADIFNKIRKNNKSKNIKELLVLIVLYLIFICLKKLYHLIRNIIKLFF